MSRPFQRVLFDIDAVGVVLIPPKESTTYTVLCHLLERGVDNKYQCFTDTGRPQSDYRKDISLLNLEYGWRIDGVMGVGYDAAAGRNQICKNYWVDGDWLHGAMAGNKDIAAFIRMVCWGDSANDDAF